MSKLVKTSFRLVKTVTNRVVDKLAMSKSSEWVFKIQRRVVAVDRQVCRWYR